jgi:hypothetical protein
MIENAYTLLAVKLVSVPIFILIVSVVGHRWGHSIGGLILGLPLTSGPVLLFLALEQGNRFASGAALGTLLGLISLSTSCLVFSRLSYRLRWSISLVGCCIVYFAVALLLNFIEAPLVTALIVVLVILAVVHEVFPSDSTGNVSRKSPVWEIPARMIAATTLVLLITGGASMLGPHLSGLLTPFPVYATIIGVFILRFDGAGASALFLRGLVTGCFTTAVFLFLISASIVHFGLIPSMSLALLVALVMHSLLLYSFKKRGR